MLQRLLELGAGLAIYSGHAEDVREQDINAQVMPPEMFERLTETIRKDGRLESLPFGVLRAAKTDGRDQIELISGHHRLRAARTAGVVDLHFVVDERELSRSAVVAKQLAHNKIHGDSDPATLKRLFDEITALDDIVESYIRPDDFDGIKQLNASQIPEVKVALEYRKVSFVFLQADLVRMEAIEEAAKDVLKGTDLVGVCSLELFERFRTVALKLGNAKEVRSMGALVTLMCDIVDEHLAKAESGDGAQA
ncbi:MAG TPA: ParB N-terminal domain-containing protein [Caulobacteraceae bacterium]